jgi:cytochrome c peroxidase
MTRGAAWRGRAAARIVHVGVSLLVLAAVGPGWAQSLLDFSADERARIAAHGPWPPRADPDPSNRASGRPAAIAWGRQLFGDPVLSASGSMSCATCHRPEHAYQDGLPTALGARPGSRNTPSVLDAAQRRWLGWDGAHDSLWAASLSPLLSPAELAQTPATLAAVVRQRPGLASGYRAAFGAAPGADDERVVVDVAKALAAFQATLAWPRSPFDDFRDALLRGDTANAARYSPAAQRGLRLFIGRGRCAVCHAGPAFTNGEFADIGLPFFLPGGGVDSGRHGGLQKLQGSRMTRLGPYDDAGRADPRAVPTRHVVPLHRHFGEFRVPGLRGLSHTAPYMHDGSLAQIEDVVRHYSELDEDRLHADGQSILRRLDLDAGEAADLAAFLRSLGPPCGADGVCTGYAGGPSSLPAPAPAPPRPKIP